MVSRTQTITTADRQETSAGEYGEDVHMDHGHTHDHSHDRPHDSQRRTTPASGTDMEKIRSTLKQLVRDWSEDVSCPGFHLMSSLKFIREKQSAMLATSL